MANDISRLSSKPKKYLIGAEDNQVEVEVYSLRIDDMELMAQLDKDEITPEEQMATMKQIVSRMLNVSIEEAGQVATEYFPQLMECAVDRMNVKSERLDAIKDMIKKKQAIKNGAAEPTAPAVQ